MKGAQSRQPCVLTLGQLDVRGAACESRLASGERTSPDGHASWWLSGPCDLTLG